MLVDINTGFVLQKYNKYPRV